MTRPGDWPRYMVQRRLRDGSTAYYWTPRPKDLRAGCTLAAEALGADLVPAIDRARALNRHLDAWRAGRTATRDPDLQPAYGTLRWLVTRYTASPAWAKVSPRSRPEYLRILALVLDLELANGERLGDAHVTAIPARAVDRIYARLRRGPRGTRVRVGVLCMQRMARAWDVVHRLYPKVVPAENPWRGVAMEHGKGTATPATRADALALHRALVAAGQPHLAAVPLICFEWHMRPENILAGHLTWTGWRPGGRAVVEIVHAKTGVRHEIALADTDGPLFPELTAYLDGLERLGPPIVLMRPRRAGGDGGHAPARPFRMRYARAIVRRAATAAGLPAWLTLAACRHGGMTELGDAGITEQGVMALSGHKTPEASRLYVKRTAAQRLAAARQRRDFVEGRG